MCRYSFENKTRSITLHHKKFDLENVEKSPMRKNYNRSAYFLTKFQIFGICKYMFTSYQLLSECQEYIVVCIFTDIVNY